MRHSPLLLDSFVSSTWACDDLASCALQVQLFTVGNCSVQPAAAAVGRPSRLPLSFLHTRMTQSGQSRLAQGQFGQSTINSLRSGPHLAGLSGDGVRARVKCPVGWLPVPAPAACRASHDTTRFQPSPDPGDHSNWVLLLRLPQAAVVTQSPQQ